MPNPSTHAPSTCLTTGPHTQMCPPTALTASQGPPKWGPRDRPSQTPCRAKRPNPPPLSQPHPRPSLPPQHNPHTAGALLTRRRGRSWGFTCAAGRQRGVRIMLAPPQALYRSLGVFRVDPATRRRRLCPSPHGWPLATAQVAQRFLDAHTAGCGDRTTAQRALRSARTLIALQRDCITPRHNADSAHGRCDMSRRERGRRDEEVASISGPLRIRLVGRAAKRGGEPIGAYLHAHLPSRRTLQGWLEGYLNSTPEDRTCYPATADEAEALQSLLNDASHPQPAYGASVPLHVLVWWTASATNMQEREQYSTQRASTSHMCRRVVSHLCGNSWCVHPHHLALQTRAEDIEDQRRHHRLRHPRRE